MNSKINISIVLPVYKGMPLLRRSVESILAQSYEDYDVIIGNDSIEDAPTTNYLKSLRDNRVRVYHHKYNLGLFGNLNFLINQSNSDIVHLWSQDDIMLPNCLSRTVAFHVAHPEIGFAFSKVKYIDANGKILESGKLDYNSIMRSKDHAITSIVAGSVAGNIANVSIKRERFKEYGLFNEKLKYSGDFDMWCRLSNDRDIGIIQEHLIKLRRHSGQLSRNPEMWIHRLVENRAIHSEFLTRIPNHKRKYVKRGLHWRIYTQNLSLLFKLFKLKKWNTAREYFSELRKTTNVMVLSIRWIIVKFATLLGWERKLFRKIYYKNLWKQ